MLRFAARWKEAQKVMREQERQNAKDQSEFFYLTRRGNIPKIEDFIKNGFDLNTRNEFGETPLFHATQARQVNVVRSLLAHGADPDIVCYETKTTPLMCASENDPVCEMLSLLLKYKADPNRIDHVGRSALFLAAYIGNLEGVKLLLANGAKVNTKKPIPALTGASAAGHLDIVKVLSAAGSRVKNIGALMAAASYGHTEIVLFLLDAGVDIHEDREAFAVAVREGHTETVRVMIERGAGIHTRKSKDNPLFWAKELGHTEIARMLKEAGAKD